MDLASHIVIYGHSLYLDAIAATLRSAPGLLVTQLHERSGIVERVAALAPDALIIERDMVDVSLLRDLSTRLMGTPVFEVYTQRSVLTIHATREIPVSGLDDLTQILERVVAANKAATRLQ